MSKLWRAAVVSLYLVALFVVSVHGYDLGSNSVVSDANGNRADNTSNITWASTPPLSSYLTDTTYTEGGLKPFLSMLRAFVYILQPKDPDYDTLLDLYRGKKSIGDVWKTLLMWAMGFAICALLGILYMVLFPFVGCFFCCCRLCGKCSGKKQHRDASECKCVGFILLMDALITIILMGVIFIILMNSRMGKSLQYVTGAIETNVDDVQTYLQNIGKEIDYYVNDGFNFTLKVLERDINYTGAIVGTDIQDAIGNDGLYAVLDQVEAMGNTVNNMYDLMNQTELQKAELQTLADAYEAQLSVYRTQVQNYLNAIAACNSNATCSDLLSRSSLLKCIIDTSQMTNLSSSLTSLGTLKSQDMEGTAKQGRADFDNIPELVTNNSQSIQTKVNTLTDEASQKLEDALSKVNGFTNKTETISKLKGKMSSFTDLIQKYEDFRKLGFYFFSVLVFLITLFWLFPLMFASCCYKPTKDPHNPPHRHCCSSCSACCFMAGAGLAWIFTILLMLFVTLPFLVGYPLDKLVCDPLTDPSYTVFSYVDGPSGILSSNGYFLSKTLYNNGSIVLSVATVLEACRNNKAIWTAMQLSNLIDLGVITKALDNVNITEALDSVDLSALTSTSLISDTTKTQLNDFKSAMNISYDQLLTALSNGTTATNVTLYIQDLGNFLGSSNGMVINLTSIYNTYGKPTDTKYAELHQTVLDLNSTGSQIPNQVDSLITAAENYQSYLAANGTKLATQVIAAFADRLFGIIKQFVNQVVNALQTEMGKCLPVWNVWYSLVHLALCNYVVDSFNGFWFALGACVFCMFLSIILSIKLSKYFWRLQPLEVPGEKKDPNEPQQEEEDQHDMERPKLKTANGFKSSSNDAPPSYSATTSRNINPDFH